MIVRKSGWKEALRGVIEDRAETCESTTNHVVRNEDPVDAHGKGAKGEEDDNILAHYHCRALAPLVTELVVVYCCHCRYRIGLRAQNYCFFLICAREIVF